MAGGDKRGTMADRVAATRAHGSPEGLRRPPGPDPMAPIGGHRPPTPAPGETATYRPTEPCHVTITTETETETETVPGILTEWRRLDGAGWEGYVAHARLVDGRSVLVREWVPARAIARL